MHRAALRPGYKRTLQISRLFLAETSADFSYSRCQGYLQIFRHGLLSATKVAAPSILLCHGVDAFDGLLAALKAASYVLSHLLNLVLFAFLHSLVLKAWQYVLGKHGFQPRHLLGYGFQKIADLVLYIVPSWRDLIHFNDNVAAILKASFGHEPTALLSNDSLVAESIGGAGGEGIPFSRMACIRLSVGYVTEAIVRGGVASYLRTYRLVRSLHILAVRRMY